MKSTTGKGNMRIPCQLGLSYKRSLSLPLLPSQATTPVELTRRYIDIIGRNKSQGICRCKIFNLKHFKTQFNELRSVG